MTTRPTEGAQAPNNHRPAEALTYARLFDWPATERLAARLGFDPTKPGTARDLLDEIHSTWTHPHGISEELSRQGDFYLALGFWLCEQFTDNGLPVPGFASSWYNLFARVLRGDTVFYEVDPDTSIDPRWLGGAV